MELLYYHPMNGSAHIKLPARRIIGLRPWLQLCGCLCLLLARPALATDAIWPPPEQWGQVFDYAVPGNPPPVIDATAFDNENQFNISFAAPNINEIVHNPEIFETWNTINYTNNGQMTANNPSETNIFFLNSFLNSVPGCGFLFDTQTTNVISRKMAGTFYNPGTIRANSIIDNNNNINTTFGFSTIFGLNFITVGKVSVWATNIVNPGIVTVGQDGLMQFTGQNVDLTRSQLTLENVNTLQNIFFNIFGGFSFSIQLNYNILDGFVGTLTNEVNPAVQFQLPNPTSDAFGPLLGLKNAQAYVDDTGVFGSNRIVRAVFISNPIPNVTNNVYFNGSFGDIMVEWLGSYVNPATGLMSTNKMYLNDDFGLITNLQVLFNGEPYNYTWFSQFPFPLGTAAPTGLPAGTFAAGYVTNDYSYESIQLTPSTVATNANIQNPSGALTNLAGRIQINASHVLDLTLAQIAGPNYLSLTATNHYVGSSGAAIFAPYCDINLAVTNGTMSVSNLLAPSVPNWNGPVQVYSARWITVDATGVTNDFHVLLVNSQAMPTTPPLVQDLILHSTNLYVSDAYTVTHKIAIDATSLTVTTNLETDGFGSPSGELNWHNTPVLNSTQFPNLRWLTNNGAIRAFNTAIFGSPATVYGAFINNGLLADQGNTIYAQNFLSSGAISNGVGGFFLQSQTTTLTNGSITGQGDIAITTGSLLTSNLMLSGRSLTLQVTNLLTDTGVTNGNFWLVGNSNSLTGAGGFNLPVKPAMGDLLGTVITNIAWTNRVVNNTWAGLDRGVSTAGYTNNAAVGKLVLDSLSRAPGTQIRFNGTGASNAIYVDQLVLLDFASYTNRIGENLPALIFNTNLVIYYADALLGDGTSVAEKINHYNTNHLRWVPTYIGHYSSTNLVYPVGVTNTVNAPLAQSSDIDSDGDGIVNSQDSTPFLVPSQLGFALTVTNTPALAARLQWNTIPLATNYVWFKTNLISPNWSLLTNFVSPLPYPSPAAAVTVFDPVNSTGQHYYRVSVLPWVTYPF